MDAELVALAGAGANTMVALMATEVWEDVKRAIAALHHRHPGHAAAAGIELEEARNDVVAARERGDIHTEAAVTAHLHGRLSRLMEQDPQAEEAISGLVERHAPRVHAAKAARQAVK
ncbi:MAG TPA: hypothetical protein VGX23_19630 [Actinocrinis sp.]|nr:hypothetical protein [Actinocrinis sp.]